MPPTPPKEPSIEVSSLDGTKPTRRLLTADDAHTRLAAARVWLSDLQGEEALLLTPSRGAADDLLRSLEGPGALGLERRTLRQLAADLMIRSMAEEGLVPVAGLALEAIAARAVALAIEPNLRPGAVARGLEYFAPVADAPGFPRALLRTLEEIRAFGVSAERLADLGPRGRDLSLLLTLFEGLLDEGRLIDPVRMLQRASLIRPAEASQRLFARPLLVLDLSPTSPVEEALIAALVRHSPHALATAIRGDTSGIARLSRALGTGVADGQSVEIQPVEAQSVEAQSVETQPEETQLEETQYRERAAGEPTQVLELLRQRIFEPPPSVARSPKDGNEEPAPTPPTTSAAWPEPQAPTPDPRPSEIQDLVFFSAPGEGRECSEIARHLHRLAEQGVPFDTCAIALRDPDTYLPLLEETLARAGIAAHWSRGARRPDPAGRAFLALLACAAEGLSASRFAEYASLGQVPTADASGQPPAVQEVPWVEPEGEQLVFKSWLPLPGVAPGRAERGEDDDLDLDLAKGSAARDDARDEDLSGVGQGESRDPGAPVRAGALRTPRHWERLLVDAAVIEGRDRWRRRLRGARSELELRWHEMREETADPPRGAASQLEEEVAELAALEKFALPLLDELAALPTSAPWGLWMDGLQRLAVRALRQPQRVVATLAELRPMAEVGPVELDEVRRTLEPKLATLRPEVEGRRFARVFVASIEELQGRSFHTVFLPGLAEGQFPRRASEDPLLLDQDRLRLDAALPTLDERVARERLLLRIAVGAARCRLFVSYPSLDTLANRSRVPSFYALDLLRAADGRLPDLQELERRASLASSTRLGWPAPLDPQTAIDMAEFDLATLSGLMSRAGSMLDGASPDETGGTANGTGETGGTSDGRETGGTSDEADETSRRGQARYLLETNACLSRSLRSRYRRYAQRGFSSADGLITRDVEALAILAKHRLGARAHSPTSLQSFAACPYRYHLKAHLGLRPRARAQKLERMDPLVRGSLLHEAIFHLLSELSQQSSLPMRQENLPALQRHGDRVLSRLAEAYSEELAPAIPRLWADEVDGLRIDLRGWIRAMATAKEAWTPSRFELSFGLPLDPQGSQSMAGSNDPASTANEVWIPFEGTATGTPPPPGMGSTPGQSPAPDQNTALDEDVIQDDGQLATQTTQAGGLLRGALLRGAIDLVEESGEHLRITDHKTGKVLDTRSLGGPGALVVGGGEVLQPVLYGLVAESLLERPVVSSRLFYGTRRGGYASHEVRLDARSREAAKKVLRTVDEAVARGFLPAAPRQEACQHCDYRPICGPDAESRAARKSPDSLRFLANLRRMP